MIVRRQRRIDPAILIVAGVSLVVQLAYMAAGANDPTFAVPIVDAGVYHEQATEFASGAERADDAFWQPPLFPLLLGCLYRTIGVNVVAARIFLAGVAVLSCIMAWWVGGHLFSRRVGLVSGLMLALYGPFVFFSTRLLPVGLAVFLDLTALMLWLKCLERSRWYWWLSLGFVAGLGIITVPNAGVLIALVLIGLVVSDSVNFPAELAMSGGHAYAKAGELAEAEEHLLEALRLDPHYCDAAVQLAAVYLRQDRIDEAGLVARLALAWDERSV